MTGENKFSVNKISISCTSISSTSSIYQLCDFLIADVWGVYPKQKVTCFITGNPFVFGY